MCGGRGGVEVFWGVITERERGGGGEVGLGEVNEPDESI